MAASGRCMPSTGDDSVFCIPPTDLLLASANDACQFYILASIATEFWAHWVVLYTLYTRAAGVKFRH